MSARLDLRTLPSAELAPIERLLVAARTIDDIEARKKALARELAAIPESDLADIAHNWRFHARPDQLAPDDDEWSIYGWIAGRGTGKTRSGSEWVREHVRKVRPGPKGAGVLIGATAADVRDLMVEQGPSAILTISPDGERPRYEPSKRLLTWPNGALAHTRSAAEPEDIRGLSVAWAWCDEPAKWRYLKEAWENLRFALRESDHPRTIITGTPKPVPLIRKIMRGQYPGARLAPTVSTYRNWRLPATQLAELELLFEGTRLGAQELHAQLLEDVEGALWSWAILEAARWQGDWTQSHYGLWTPSLPPMARKVTAVDPPGGTAECGIIVAGVNTERPPTAYILEDHSLRGTPAAWGRAAVRAYFDSGSEYLVAETNFGADMVEHVIRTVPAEGEYPSGLDVRFKPVKAGRGRSKKERALPVASLYEKSPPRVIHVGRFPELEDQQTSWVPEETPESPDRMDAAVWAVTDLLVLHPSVGRPVRTGAQVASARLSTA